MWGLDETAFETAITDFLVTEDWYSRLDPGDLDAGSGLFADELVAFVRNTQSDRWERLKDRHGSEEAARTGLVRRVAQELDNPKRSGTVDVLRHGVDDLGVRFDLAYFRPAHRITEDLEALYQANRLGVVRQLDVGGREVVDVVVTVNGVPVATAELKNPTTGQTTADAVRQYRTDRNPANPVLRRAVVHFAADPDTVQMTTRLAGEDTEFLPFNRGRDGGAGNPAEPGRHRTFYLWERVLARDPWMEILGRFVHTGTDPSGGRRTIFPRFHQWDAVTRLLDATKQDGPGTNYLVQHSAGSGKSNTIAWLAHRLATLHDASDHKVFDKVVVVTDRTVLDDQLQETIYQFEHARGVIARIEAGQGTKSERLAAALTDTSTQIVVVTLQTFPFVLDKLTELGGVRKGSRFAVIADEAHSSQTGTAAGQMRTALTATGPGEEALAAAEEKDRAEEAAEGDPEDRLNSLVAGKGAAPNISFYAFTATPKAKTRELFGRRTSTVDGDRFEAFHTYTMRQAIEEGFILDILTHYTTYQTFWKIEKTVREDPNFDERRAKAAIARYVSLHPTNLAQKAQIIVEHFLAHTAHKIGGQAKAMVVTASRLHAVRYKQAIDRYIADHGYADRVAALVAFSGTVIDDAEYTESRMNRFPESETARRFDTDDYQVLIVAEKFQTGFDQPLLHTMYVDKKLTGLNAVQTLSRLNRRHPGKTDTFVLDFRNTADEVTEAFAPYYEHAVAVPTDPNRMFDAHRELWDRFDVLRRDDVDGFATALVSDPAATHRLAEAALTPAVDRYRTLDDDDQEEFRAVLDRFVRLYGFLSLVVTFTDLDLEKTHLYGKALLQRTVGPRPDRIDVGDKVALTHLRMDTTFQGSASVTEAVHETTQMWSGRGPLSDEAQEALSVIVKEMNDRFGETLTEEDRLVLDQYQGAFVTNEAVAQAARTNDFDKFREVVFEPQFLTTIINQMDANEKIFKRILSDAQMRTLFAEYLARTVYDEVRNHP